MLYMVWHTLGNEKDKAAVIKHIAGFAGGNMYDSLRESLSYFGLYKRMFKVKKVIDPQKIFFGNDVV